jgi:Lipocalin-like domain
MIAYEGTYTIDGDKVIHHVDISCTYTGTDQVRFFKVEGDTLTIRTAPNKSPIDGREGVGILVWEGEVGSAQIVWCPPRVSGCLPLAHLPRLALTVGCPQLEVQLPSH